MNLSFSIIVPIYNRPDEVEELLDSLSKQNYTKPFEVVLVEDGSTEKSDLIAYKYKEKLDIAYYYKENSGPGDSRNFGMQKAQGNYFIIFDSDCVIPPNYLSEVTQGLTAHYTDCFGGPDAAMDSFSKLQKAINYSMTSFLTTGGIRGKSEKLHKFQPRSFNMGIAKVAFEKSAGFARIHPGEDPDLTIRLWKLGFDTQLLQKAFVYHKRRISWSKFYTQVNKFGQVRPILDKWHPKTSKLTYWFPTLFSLGLLMSILFSFFNIYYFIYLYIIYFGVLFIDSSIKNKNLIVGIQSVYAALIQFIGYGYGFIKSKFKLINSNQKAEAIFPHLFFKK